MMIRIKFNYNTYTLNGERVVSGKPLCGNQVPVLLRSGDFTYVPFSGFENNKPISNRRLAKIIDVMAFYEQDEFSPPIDMKKNHYCVGELLSDNSIVMLLENGLPIQYPIKPVSFSKFVDNVVNLPLGIKKNG